MPDKPTWLDNLPTAIQALEALPFPWVDTATLETALGVGKRQAQRIIRPLIKQTLGLNGLAIREEVIEHLHRLANGDAAYYETRRRERLRSILDELHSQAKSQPRVMVEAPVEIINQEVDGLPAGVLLQPGKITVEFSGAQEALEKLLAIAMAAGNDFDRFSQIITS